MHCELIIFQTELTLRRVCPFAPVIKLDVGTAEVQDMLSQPHPVHFRICCHGCTKAIPPHKMEIIAVNDILVRKEGLRSAVPPVRFKGLMWESTNLNTGHLNLYKFKREIATKDAASGNGVQQSHLGQSIGLIVHTLWKGTPSPPLLFHCMALYPLSRGWTWWCPCKMFNMTNEVCLVLFLWWRHKERVVVINHPTVIAM